MKRFEHYVVLKDTKTGETRAIQAAHDGVLHEGTEFMWNEGNYSCDCNREIFFYGHNIDHTISCGNSRFRIIANNIPGLRNEADEANLSPSPPLTTFEEKRD